MRMKYVFALLGLFCFFSSCKHYNKNASHQQISDNSIAAGEKLAKQYCGSCHMFPDPSMLNSKSWQNGVLPEMGPRLGIFFYGDKEYPSYKKDILVNRDYYPSQAVLSFADWQHIIDYYTSVSPDSLRPAKRGVPVTINNNLFIPETTSFKYYAPATSYVKIDAGKLTTCDAFKTKLYLFNNKLQVSDSLYTTGAVTQVLEDSGADILCNTGILSPNNGKYGSIVRVSLNKKVKDSILYGKLMRPVNIVPADLNKDGKTDLIVCEFGNLEGALSWLEKTDTGYVRHIIRAAPGAIKTYVDDYNHDGLPDIWALFAQGDESIYLFTNKGNGTFIPQRVLRFPPVYGSSDFEVADLNNDGYPDIIYTCGDNADFSQVLKPYHGVYIFLNDGKNNFTQKYFYPLNGCYKAVARDFDGDGDLDIATISFFADYKNHPEEGFVYLKNNGNFNFTPYTMDAVKYGRWLTMDVGDFDGDGKPDIMLGNFSLKDTAFNINLNHENQPPFLLLKNIQ